MNETNPTIEAINKAQAEIEAKRAAEASKLSGIGAAIKNEMTSALKDTLATLTPEKVAEVEAALADAARLTARLLVEPDNAEAIKAELAFPLSTVASITATTAAETRVRLSAAAYNVAFAVAHIAMTSILTAA